MELNGRGIGGFKREQDAAAITDPLKKYLRMVHMHRWDELSLDFMLDDRTRQCMVTRLGQEPYAVQTMFHFKPPGGRGQALHQDQTLLPVQPSLCMPV